MKREITIFDSEEELFDSSTVAVTKILRETIQQYDRCTLLLSGGSTPRRLYQLLADKKFTRDINWRKVFFFWGDERCVSPDDDQSNFRLASETLLSRLTIPQSNIMRIRGELHPSEAGKEYERTIKKFFGDNRGLPVFDIAILGMGEDGHTASLFPGSPALEEKKRWVVDVKSPKPPTQRITLTLPIINNARTVLFLVSGTSKADAFKHFAARLKPNLPATLVQPTHGSLLWMVDKEAASKIDHHAARR